MAALDRLRRNMAAVAFANSVRDACPACAWAPRAADDRRRNRTIADASPASPAFHLIADRRSPIPPPVFRQARRTRFCSMGNFPPGGTAAGESPQIPHPEREGTRSGPPGRRRIHHETGMEAPGPRTETPPARVHRGRLPCFACRISADMRGADSPHVEFPGRIPADRPTSMFSASRKGKNAFPP